MKEQTFFLKTDDQAELFVRQWAKVLRPKAVLQVAHGMAEHSGRYTRFAHACNEQDLIVFANDHRGHGHTGERAGLMGYFAPKDGFERAVNDLYVVNHWIQGRYPELPIFLLGHSMGSFLARRYIQKFGKTLRGTILMGSAGNPGIAARLGKLIARLQMRGDPTRPSRLLDRLTLGGYNKGIKNPRTKFDWLSRDEAEVRKYMEDPFCGFVCSSGFFFDLFTGLLQIHDPALIENIPQGLPILVISGEADAVGNGGKGIQQFVNQYHSKGLTSVKTVLYPGSRHELLNETNREEVIRDILLWVYNQIG